MYHKISEMHNLHYATLNDKKTFHFCLQLRFILFTVGIVGIVV